MKLAVGCFLFSLFLFGCVTTGPETVPTIDWSSGGAVAVWDLEDVSPMGVAQPDLAEFISARVLETLKAQGADIVERQKLLMVLKELSLGESQLADPETQLRIGRLSGAKRMIFGGYQVVGKSMRIDLRLVDVETSRVLTAAKKIVEGGNLDEWLDAAENATRELCK